MGISFILGRGGSGKTYLCQQEILLQLKADSSEPIIFLVPEQATYQVERAFINSGDINGYSRLNILSFERLGFHLQGRFFKNRHINRMGQELVIARILKTNKSRLKVFANSVEQIGTARQVVDIITELHKSQKNGQDIDEIIKKLIDKSDCRLTAAKFEDIKLIYTQYLEFIKDKKFFDSDYELSGICKKIQDSEFFKNRLVWIDGFSDFTFQEEAILREILKVCKQARLALCLDGEKIDIKTGILKDFDQTNLFWNTENTYYKFITEIIPKTGKKIEPPTILTQSKRFEKSKGLNFLEKNLFDDNNRDKTFSAGDDITSVCAINSRSEVEFTAREITRLVFEKNLRWRDIAVVVPELEKYKHFINAIFADYKIPYFLDAKRTVIQDKLSMFLISALNFACGDFTTDDIICSLKSGFIDISRDNIDLLENYCCAAGIGAGDWNKPQWDFNITDFPQQLINILKEKAVSDLLWFKETIGKEKAAYGKFASDLKSFITRMNISAKLSPDRADFYQSFISQLEDAFNATAAIFDGEMFSANEFTQLFIETLSQITVSFIPLMLDQVLVGSIDRSRHPDIKAAFLLGATQKNFPTGLKRQSLLTDADRSKAQANGFELISTLQRQVCSRQYLAYIAFTRPSNYLYITYPMVDEKGSAIQKSQFVGLVEETFTGCLHRYCGIDSGQSIINSKIEFKDYISHIASKGNNIKQYAQQLAQNIECDDNFKKELKELAQSWDYKNDAQLDKTLAESFFENPMKLSASQLTLFASCQFSHFASYMLKLKPRKEMVVEPMDRGHLYHKVIELLTTKMMEDNCGFINATDEQLKQYTDFAFEKAVTEDSLVTNYIKKNRHNYYSIYSAKEMLQDFVIQLGKTAKAGKFILHSSEKDFGKTGDQKVLINLENGWTGYIKGIIDRLDICEIDGKKYALVLDYKTGGKKFSISKFAQGLDLQLTIYLLAAEAMGFEPFGAFYINITGNTGGDTEKARGILNGSRYQLLDDQTNIGWSNYYNFHISKEKTAYSNYETSGAFYPEEFENIINLTKEKIKTICNRILNGKIDVNPYRISNESACDWCQYRSLCRMDWLYNNFRNIPKITKQEIKN